MLSYLYKSLSSPRISSAAKIFGGFFFLLGLFGIFSYEKLTNVYYRYNFLPATAILELLLAAIFFKYVSWRVDWLRAVIAAGAITYTLIASIRFFYGEFEYSSFSDFVVQYKAFYYISIISLTDKNKLSAPDILFIFRIIIVIFLIKYTAGKVFFDIPRPGVYYENNFELMMPLLFFLYLAGVGILKFFDYLALTFLVAISGSFSAVVVCTFIFGKIIFSGKSGGLLLKIAFSLFGFLIVAYFYEYKYQNIDSFHDIDRLKFLDVFLQEVKIFDIYKWVFGQTFMEPLSYQACLQLYWYQTLFSDAIYGNCYSVILHSFVMRALYDHGILGLLFLFLSLWLIFYIKFNKSFATAIVVCVIVNGLSVAALNSVYIALPLVMIILAAGGRKYA